MSTESSACGFSVFAPFSLTGVARVRGRESSNFYHGVARAIEGRMIFDAVAKEKFGAWPLVGSG